MTIFGRLAAGAVLAACAASAAAAQDYPSRPVTLVVPFAAGGPADSLARLVAEPMSKALGQQIVVENLGGAGGTLAADKVSQADADGYTIMIYNQGFAAGPALYSSLPYDPVADFTSIGLISYGPMVLVGRKDMPAPDATALVEALKTDPAITFAHAGVGGVAHLCGLIFGGEIGVKLKEVPYRGGAPAMQDLLGGHVDLYCGLWDTFEPMRGDLIKGYAVLGAERLEGFPDIPTMVELGYPNLEVSAWYGIFGPAGLPEDVVARLNGALAEALADPKLQETLTQTGSYAFDEELRSPAAAAAYLVSEMERLGAVIRANGVKLD